MAVRNSIKILFNIFSVMWVIVLYGFIVGTIVVSLALAALIPIVGAINSLNFGAHVGDAMDLILSGDNIGEGVILMVDTFKSLFQIFDKPSKYFVSYLFVVLILGVFGRALAGYYELPVGSILNERLSSNMPENFWGKFVANMARSTKYVWFKLLVLLPCDVIAAFALYGIFQLFSVDVISFFVPFLLMLTFLMIMSLRSALTCFWQPRIVVDNTPVIAALKLGLKDARAHFSVVFSSMVLAWLIIIVINVMFGVFTFGVGLIITIPISMLFLNLVRLTLYYGIQERRYYLDGETVYNPKKS